MNEQNHLAVMHTIWVREHNRLEERLHRLNPHWSGDVLYEETRRIVSAMVQHVTFNEFLPIVLGQREIKRHGLELLTKGYFEGRRDERIKFSEIPVKISI